MSSTLTGLIDLGERHLRMTEKLLEHWLDQRALLDIRNGHLGC